jgi:hypothetical protein
VEARSATVDHRDAAVSLPLVPIWRVVVAVAGIANLAAAAHLATQPAWLMDGWPWELTRLSALFLAAMLAAVGAAAVWMAASAEGAAVPAGFLNLAVTGFGVAGWLALREPDLRWVALAIAVIAAADLAVAVLAHRRLHRGVRGPARPLPPLVRWSFLAFSLVLAAVGLALVTGIADVMPWSVGPGTAQVFGWIFLGDAVFFAYPLVWSTADEGRAQLWSFLGYDLVLLPPLAATLPDVDPSLRPNLVVYLAVLVWSAALGLWWLVVRPLGTRR